MTTATTCKIVKVLNRKLIPLKRLKDAPHNPKNRVAKKNIMELADSMELIGLMCPIIVTAAEQIIDGHRRVAAARLLEWDDIEANIVEEDPSTVYASVNVTSRRMSGNDALSVWLVNQAAVRQSASAKFATMRDEIGMPLVKRIADAGYSLRVWQTAKRLCRYCEDATKQTLQSVVKWLLDTATIGQVMKAMEAGESPKVIMEAVRKGKPVVFRLTIQE